MSSKSPLLTVESQNGNDHGEGPVPVPISSLLPADSPRLKGEDEKHIERLAQMDEEMPPILVHRQTMTVVDGMHRLRLAELRGQETIATYFFDGTVEEAFLKAVEANIRHGLPLTLAERKAAASRIILSFPDFSDRLIARQSGLSPKTVAGLRRHQAANLSDGIRKGADGRVRPLDPTEGRRRAREVISARPQASLREIAKAAGISVGTAKDVRDQIQRRNGSADAYEKTATAMYPSSPTERRRRPGERRRPEQEIPSKLECLRRDPALRSTESGRELLRWLYTHASEIHRWREMVASAPTHSVELLARLAKQCSDEWRTMERNLKTDFAVDQFPNTSTRSPGRGV
ncbi:ParB N-terminal domain-containing protein [Actinomadura meridiana]|uniref:ParB N-terminal domain-containing protein n=2 Tax=Actinomadura meridiana TaxID=559626 RepID=A0ABP8BSV8_9ACTN